MRGYFDVVSYHYKFTSFLQIHYTAFLLLLFSTFISVIFISCIFDISNQGLLPQLAIYPISYLILMHLPLYNQISA